MCSGDYWYRSTSYGGPFFAVDVRSVPSGIFAVAPGRWHAYPVRLERWHRDRDRNWDRNWDGDDAHGPGNHGKGHAWGHDKDHDKDHGKDHGKDRGDDRDHGGNRDGS
jgi:hypothetical protein